MQVTLLTCTPDIESKLFKRHAEALKKNTNNYEWLIIDNNRKPDFNHAREINRAIFATSNKFLITLDDDLIVTNGWIEGLLEAAQKSEVVGGVHRFDNKNVNHSGGYILPNGIAGHYTGNIRATAFVHYVCSAVLLIDLEFIKEKKVFFDENYIKFFQDADYCFRVWEAGGSVAVTEKCDVIHLVGQAVGDLSNRSALFNKDSRYFNNKWVSSSRLKSLMEKIENRLDHDYKHGLKKLYELHTGYADTQTSNNLKAQESIIEKLSMLKNYDSAVRILEKYRL